MLGLYLASLGVGAALWLVSFLAGGDSDGHVDGDGLHGAPDGSVEASDGDGGADDGHGDGDGHAVGLGTFFPVLSLSFWTFFFAFFGLTGAVLTALGLFGSALVVGLVAAAMGYASGQGVGLALRRLRRQVVNSSVADLDVLHATGRLLLPAGGGQLGKVRLTLGGRSYDLPAEAETESPLAASADVIVWKLRDDGTVVVIPLVPEVGPGRHPQS